MAKKSSQKLAKPKKQRAARVKALPMWAQLRKAYEFATPKEQAKFNAMANALMEKNEVTGQSYCPGGPWGKEARLF